ncbi:NADH-quinone oxidoreductase subunit NuoE [Aestuariivirga litoralis]|uniref:NADH-quinone oxidoreductase subunit NuoE n=1 Tax=Aestuariivirga litoralis TaxID=2650924 RepID=UPI0018C4F94F|nr:NADH-quinone oxidoreductase subunit NuoE [Aestuariivirga litoralis]
MSVRRLDPVQPANFMFSPENQSWARKTVAKFPPGKQASAVIQLLWRAQEQEGWVSKPCIEYVGKMLEMSFIRVLEVATFYTMFHLSPVGRKAHFQVCGTTPCQLRGAEDLIAVCQRKIHHDPHHLNADGTMSWEEVECLGSCVNAPMMQVFKDTYEDLTPQSLEKIIDDFAAGRAVTPGPQNGRHFSMAITGATSLTDKALYGKQRTFKRVEAPPPPPPAAPAAAAPAPAAPAPAPAPAAASSAPAAPAAVSAPVAPAPAPNAPAVTRVAKVADVPAAKAPAKKVAPAKKAAPVKSAGPELLKKPRGKADDLKLIWGVGPSFEKLLNKVGVWHFDQVASWKSADIDHVDALLKGFHGRIRRDDWVPQAKKLAKGWRPDNDVGEKPKGKK